MLYWTNLKNQAALHSSQKAKSELVTKSTSKRNSRSLTRTTPQLVYMKQRTDKGVHTSIFASLKHKVASSGSKHGWIYWKIARVLLRGSKGASCSPMWGCRLRWKVKLKMPSRISWLDKTTSLSWSSRIRIRSILKTNSNWREMAVKKSLKMKKRERSKAASMKSNLS